MVLVSRASLAAAPDGARPAESELRAALKATMGAYAEYDKARADAADKCTVKSTTSKTTKSESKSDEAKTKDGAKEPAEGKTVASTSSEEVKKNYADGIFGHLNLEQLIMLIYEKRLREAKMDIVDKINETPQELCN